MRLKIDIVIPNWTKWLAGGVALGVVLTLGAVVLAQQVSVPNTFSDGDILSAKKINDNFLALQNAINNPDPTCPRGYVQDASVTSYVVCKKGVDEVVKVGTGGSTFWIDRYEASVWAHADGTAPQYGSPDPNNPGVVLVDYPASFPRNGQADKSNLLFAISKAGVQPSAFITWFQAARACRASGKRLPNGEEWLESAAGTNDPGANTGVGGACVTHASSSRTTAQGTTCVSTWGSQDMIGNVLEWTSEWSAAPGTTSGIMASWPSSELNDDAVWNVVSGSWLNGAWRTGYPVAVSRGGAFGSETYGGVFALDLSYDPEAHASAIGFRCLLPN